MKHEETNTGVAPITYAQDEHKITVTISGGAFENLAKIADAINKTEWCNHDNTPLSVFQNWVGQLIDQVADNSPSYCGSIPYDGIWDVIEDAAASCCAEYDEDSPEYDTKHEEVLNAIRARFNA